MTRFLPLLLLLGAPASAAEAAKPNPMAMMLPWIAILGIFYFLIIRPQQRQAKDHQKMVDDLKRGDRIITQGGFYATIDAVKGKILQVKIADGVTAELDRAFVAKVIRPELAQETAAGAKA